MLSDSTKGGDTTGSTETRLKSFSTNLDLTWTYTST